METITIIMFLIGFSLLILYFCLVISDRLKRNSAENLFKFDLEEKNIENEQKEEDTKTSEEKEKEIFKVDEEDKKETVSAAPEKMTRNELIASLSSKGIKGLSRLKKDELVKLYKENF